MSIVQWITETLRTGFLDTYLGVFWLIAAYVVLRLGLEAIRDRQGSKNID